MATFSASRTANLRATSPSLAMIAALASAAASSLRTRLRHTRCKRHAEVCARLHDGRKLCGEGRSAGGKCGWHDVANGGEGGSGADSDEGGVSGEEGDGGAHGFRGAIHREVSVSACARAVALLAAALASLA